MLKKKIKGPEGVQHVSTLRFSQHGRLAVGKQPELGRVVPATEEIIIYTLKRKASTD